MYKFSALKRIALTLLVGCTLSANSQMWVKVTNANVEVSVPAGTTTRYGVAADNLWSASTVFATAKTFTVNGTTFHDPDATGVHELQVLQTAAPQLVTVGIPTPVTVSASTTPTWVTISQSNEVIITSTASTLRLGVLADNLWVQLSVAANKTFVANSTTFNPDPDPHGSPHILQVLQTSADQNFVVGVDAVVTVPALAVVGPVAPTITWATPAPVTYGAALTASILDATASVPGTFTYSPALGSVPSVGTDTLTAYFTPTDTTDYTTVTSTVQLVVNQVAGPGVTWYIRGDGGTRYSTRTTTGQCDGKADVGYSGTGVNQHCAFNDYRFLWDDQSYGNDAWVISGGDTVIIRNGPYRVGYDNGTGSSSTWCFGGGGPYACFSPVLPAGTATQHTRRRHLG
jgi:hypothetical protein